MPGQANWIKSILNLSSSAIGRPSVVGVKLRKVDRAVATLKGRPTNVCFSLRSRWPQLAQSGRALAPFTQAQRPATTAADLATASSWRAPASTLGRE